MFRGTRWVTHDTWVCIRHLPSVRLPAAASECWYSSCPIVRPSLELRPKVIKPKVVLPPVTIKPMKKRGSVALSCAVCGSDTYRKPSDVKRNRSGVFFCRPEHASEWRSSKKSAVVGGSVTLRCILCSDPAGPKSKYCSRQCSNRNAHLRSKERKRKLVVVA